MSERMTYLITGANRGIGLGLVAALLQRSDTTVIATVRDKDTTDCVDLLALPLAKGSNLLIESLAVADETSVAALGQTLLHERGIKTIDVVIANAGIGTQFQSCLDTTTASLKENFEINTLAPILLFQTLHPFLTSTPRVAVPKFIVVSSVLGSIASLGEDGSPILAYGVSKAGVNFFVRKLHFEMRELVTLAVHPGWVKTGNGQAFADTVGVSEPPLTVEQSVEGVLRQIDNAGKDSTSGCFVSYDGSVIGY